MSEFNQTQCVGTKLTCLISNPSYKVLFELIQSVMKIRKFKMLDNSYPNHICIFYFIMYEKCISFAAVCGFTKKNCRSNSIYLFRPWKLFCFFHFETRQDEMLLFRHVELYS